jgi:hypothetical protein
VPVIAVVAEVLEHRYTHSQLDRLFEEVGCPGEPPAANKLDKVRDWLKRANAAEKNLKPGSADPLNILGQLLQEVMEDDSPGSTAKRIRIEQSLAKYGLAYEHGGRIFERAALLVTRTLEEMIRSRDLGGLHAELERTLQNVETDPRTAITGACALSESMFKVYIQDESLQLPSKETIKPLWAIVQKHLQLNPGLVQDEDIRRILSGLSSIVDGIGSLRTHAGSAHGHGRSEPAIDARHARGSGAEVQRIRQGQGAQDQIGKVPCRCLLA